MTERGPRLHKPVAFLRMMRPSRTVMVAIIAGTGAFAAGAGTIVSLWMILSGWTLAVGGLTCALIFSRRPSPRLAYILTYVFMMGMGSVISMAIILGSL